LSFDAFKEWFSEGANALSAAQVLAAFVTALATLALWRVTKVLAVETKTLAALTSRPFVVCSLESSRAGAIAMNLTLRNTGNATAFDVRLELSPALNAPCGNASEEPLTKWDVSMLPPGQALTTQGVMGPDIHGNVYSATVSWAAMPGASVRETLSYSFAAKDGFRGGWNTKGTHHVAEELEKIRIQLSKN
jgi:hypothetical protein